jgi:hypothetical protein
MRDLNEPMPAERLRLIAGIAAAAVIVVIAWLLLKDDGSSASGEKATGAPTIATAAELRALSDSLGHPLYWAGPLPGTRLELTDEADGRVYVRYLDGSAGPGDPRPDFLTVGTYPVPDATAAIRRASHTPGTKVKQLSNGAVALVNTNKPTSVYIAYPGADSQIEVYDPSAKRALGLVLSGQIKPVGG